MKFAPTIIFCLLAGCASQNAPPPAPPQEGPPPAPVSADEKSLQTKYESAKAEFKKNPAAKTKYVEATVAYADAVMYGDSPPREKYSNSLALFEEALRADPTNAEAKKNREMILAIYKQMGREPKRKPY